MDHKLCRRLFQDCPGLSGTYRNNLIDQETLTGFYCKNRAKVFRLAAKKLIAPEDAHKPQHYEVKNGQIASQSFSAAARAIPPGHTPSS
ncbi:MAG: hypothetical protein E4H01_11385 [Lysobacterales bacterium]|nr:MAG: hypothetical protein E4H01_11385 [Xanthomonadales bacterium]